MTRDAKGSYQEAGDIDVVSERDVKELFRFTRAARNKKVDSRA